MSTAGRKIGFVGVGNMGWPMAAHLVAAGHDVTAFDADAGRAERWAAEHKARSTADPAALGRHAEIVVTMLPSGREVRDVLLERDRGALAANLQKGAIVVDMSSADPVGTQKLGEELAACGIALVDAPVSGLVTKAREATLAIMIGGDAAHIAAVRPVLEKLGSRLTEVGPLGCGHAMKCLNNFLGATGFAAGVEALRVGRAFGLDPAVMLSVINASTGRSFMTENIIGQEVLSGRYGTGFALGLLAKDVGIAADLAGEIGADNPIGRLTRDLWVEARDALGADQDHTRAALAWEKRGGR